ncbi:MAG: hypothetical protein LBB08_01640 [Rickettsiales bacterium]|jgi:hypothetical protein|nr:hypothetical protein [Rickettsiales bacterium]
MKSRMLYAKIQGWLGGLFVVCGVALIVITLMSVPAVADPIQVEQAVAQVAQSPRGGGARSGRAAQVNPRTAAHKPNVAMTASSSAIASQPKKDAVSSRARGISARPNYSGARTGAAAAATTSAAKRSVGVRTARSRGGSGAASAGRRAVVARAGAGQARVALSGSAIRASRSSGYSAARAGTSSLYPATYSSIIDPTTGLISADAYSNCLSSYYTCMDEVCSVRSPGQRRCACAGRVKTFNAVETTLQTAKEDLIKVSGELSLLIATKGESIQSAFQLTEAEKSLNCVSYRDAMRNKSQTEEEWCKAHFMPGSSGNWNCNPEMNATCSGMYGGNGSSWMDALNGADSDILSALNTYASTINEVNTITYDDESGLAWSYNNVASIVGASSNSVFVNGETGVDTLAQTWGYNLFQYAHNNVCGRVLDSCFNGIYEACGNRPAESGGGTGPYNLNSKITVTNDGNEVSFIQAKNAASANANASCYGYANTSGDPYSSLRVPVADARISILQKYVLDANADCDVYGEELKKQAQNMGYQKLAATQMLQKKRLEFAQEKENARTEELVKAKENYLKCVDEIQQCRQDKSNDSSYHGNTVRIKAFCNQMSNVPTCFEEMLCNQEATEIIRTGNTRNTVLMSEIVAASSAPAESCIVATLGVNETSLNAKDGIRQWEAPSN